MTPSKKQLHSITIVLVSASAFFLFFSHTLTDRALKGILIRASSPAPTLVQRVTLNTSDDLSDSLPHTPAGVIAPALPRIVDRHGLREPPCSPERDPALQSHFMMLSLCRDEERQIRHRRQSKQLLLPTKAVSQQRASS